MIQKKVPLRKCIITNERFSKNELIRIVRNKDGVVTVDHSGKLNGRGAYLKKDLSIIKKAIKTKKLDKQLQIEIPEKIYKELLELFNG